MGTPLTRPPSAQPVSTGAFVLTGRALAPGWTLESTSRYDDPVWMLTPALLQHQLAAARLDFTTVAPAFVAVVKQLCFAMLAADLPPDEPRPKIMSVRRLFCEFKRFSHWVAEHTDAPTLTALSLDDLDAYARHLPTVLSSEAAREVAQSAVRLFWRYRTVLSADRLSVDPLTAEGWGNSTRRARGENTTPRIPEQVMGPLLVWCLRIIDLFGPDILAAQSRWRSEPSLPRSRGGTGERVVAAERVDRLTRLLDSHLATSTPLPGYRGRVNRGAMLTAIGIPGSKFTEQEEIAIAAVADQVGLCAETDIGIQIHGRLDDRPWIPFIGRDRGAHGLLELGALLQAACYITIAYLSGMRDSELKHLRRGAVRTWLDSHAQPYRWTVTSRAFKGETDPAGTEATWIIGAPAARAITTLEQLQHPDTDLLFANLSYWKKSTRDAMMLSTTNTLINAVISWVNTYCTEHGRTDTIPDIGGTPWRLTTRQFRRTLAWHIARRPGGSIAGAIQYRHLSIQMFEGYAGTSESGFRAEVEAEQALARGEVLLDLATEHVHELRGPAAAEATTRLHEFATRTGFEGTVVTDSRRLERILRSNDPHIHPGTYVTCVFNPDKALCQPRTDHTGQLRPTAANCQPLECRNVALTRANTQALTHERDTLDTELAARPALPPQLDTRLRQRRKAITALIDNDRSR